MVGIRIRSIFRDQIRALFGDAAAENLRNANRIG
jgi:hypothetical protein